MDTLFRSLSTAYIPQIRNILLKFICPSLTTTERDALSSQEGGRVIFNKTIGKFQGYDGSTWNSVEDVPNTVENLSDNFDDNTLNTVLWSTDYAVEQNQRLEFSTTAIQQEVILDSVNYYTFKNSSLFFKFYYDHPGSDHNVRFNLEGYDDSRQLFILISDTTFNVVSWEDGEETTEYTTTYNSTTHRWLRFRDTSDTWYVDVSSDGSSWTNVASKSDAYITSGDVRFRVDILNESGNNATSYIDNVNC